MTIKKVHSREIIDSRGNPTLEVDIYTENGLFRADVPSGSSTGIYEALELRDKEKDRYFGEGVKYAIHYVNNVIGPKLVGLDETKQTFIDNLMIEMDGTLNKCVFGANSILGVSMAVCRAGASKKGLPLYKHISNLAGHSNNEWIMPVPSFNVINGGTHAGNKLAMQEFMILPTGASNFQEAIRMGVECYHHLKYVIKEKYGQDAINVGDEGGFAPNIKNNKEGLELLKIAINKAGYTGKVKIGMDVAASEFYQNGKYNLDFKNKKGNEYSKIDGKELSALYSNFIKEYPIISIEDPFDQDDWTNYEEFTKEYGNNVQIVGDDLLVTNPSRIEIAIKNKSCNALLLKVNQIGTITETIKSCNMAINAGWNVMVSHRSGETEDTFIADLVIGLKTGQIKTGAPCRSERTAKYNQLLRIAEELGDNAIFGKKGFPIN